MPASPYLLPGQYAQHFPGLLGPSQEPHAAAPSASFPRGARPKAQAKRAPQAKSYAAAAAGGATAASKPTEPTRRESQDLILARKEVALYKEMLPPGHPKLVQAQEALRTAKFKVLQAKEPSKQVQSLKDQIGSHSHRIQTLLGEGAHVELQLLERVERHKAISHEVAELSLEVDSLGVQLKVAKRTEARARPQPLAAQSEPHSVASVC